MSNQISNCFNGSGNRYGGYDDNTAGGYYKRKSYGGYGKKKSYRPAFSTKPSYQSYTESEEEHSYSYEPVDSYGYDSYTPKSTVSKYIGTRVYHENFGYGTITAVSGQMCEVDFDDVGHKKVMGSYLTKA